MKPEDADRADESGAAKPPGKTYQKPRLEVYGDIAQIARDLMMGAQMDGSGHPNKHFTS
jgi:hypothetical protein